MVIDITMTATCRANIVNKTLLSFTRNMFNSCSNEHCFRLIVNIDPVGPDTQVAVEYVCKEYFNNIIINKPDSAHFPRAFKWCWSQVSAAYVFNLEDDWELMRFVCLVDMTSLLDGNSALALLRLPAWRIEERSKNWRYFYNFNGRYFECPSQHKREVGFCGHPSLIKGDFVKRASILLSDGVNPEKQFHARGKTELMSLIDNYEFGVYGVQHQQRTIADIGRQWMLGKYVKSGSKAFFKTWDKVG